MNHQTGSRIAVTTADRPDLTAIAAEWIWSAFWKKNGYSRDEIRALVTKSDAIFGPSKCMLLLVDGDPVGTASLIKCDLDSRQDLTPWLAAMYVKPEYRGRGYAFDLVRAVERAAAIAGYTEIWLYTCNAEGLYRKAGWRSVERFEQNGNQAVLMNRVLNQSNSN